MRPLRSRREILKLSVVAAGAVPAACYRSGTSGGALPPEQSARYFPQSIASGDPRPQSVVLWTRVVDERQPESSLLVRLLVALDPDFSQLTAHAESLIATKDFDHCVRVRITELTPGTTYYYRFQYFTELGVAETRVGRTRTAPALDADVNVKFGVVCCQDYDGRYYHVHRHLAQQELDFVLHLGDYVYESVGDPTFQAPSAERTTRFSAPEEALQLQRGEGRPFLAAQSLSNYRDLYKTYRSDPDLQLLHESHPMIAIWDDHEFSDDAHGDVATYQDGRVDESSPDRRAAADRAWYEYMPVDYDGMPAQSLDETADFPDNFGIYRGFVFGRHLELLVTDLRRFRPDHLVPEDAPPGAVFMTQAELEEELGELPADAVAYVDVETYGGGDYLAALQAGAETLQITPAKLSGEVSAVWINQALTTLGVVDLPAIDLEDPALERGYAYHCLLKNSEFSRIGARYVVAVRPFEALARKRYRETGGASELLMGQRQRDWFVKQLRDSTRTFKVWGSEIAFLSRHVDLTGVELAPPELQTRISISTEDWDGFPNERRALLEELVRAGNAVILSGDLHCFFAGTPCLVDDPVSRVVELTTGSVTSTTWLDAIEGNLTEDAAVSMDLGLLVQSVQNLLTDRTRRPNPHLAFQELRRHGYSVIEAGPDELSMTLRTIGGDAVVTPPGDLEGELDELFDSVHFRTRAGTADLEREVNGKFLTWSMDEMEFV
jgi:alkaline phosphatase D